MKKKTNNKIYYEETEMNCVNKYAYKFLEIDNTHFYNAILNIFKQTNNKNYFSFHIICTTKQIIH